MLNYRILPEHRLVAVCNWETSSLKQIVELRNRLECDPLYSNAYDIIMDVTYLERLYTRREIENLALRVPISRASAVKLAIVAPTDASFGVSRMYQMLTEDDPMVDMHVFRNSGAALQWLDREGLDIENLFDKIMEA